MSSTTLIGVAKDFVTETSFEKDFLLYPNPVKGNILNIKLKEAIDVNYRILNISGQTVASGRMINDQINVESLKSGVYFVEINDGDEVMTKRFIRE